MITFKHCALFILSCLFHYPQYLPQIVDRCFTHFLLNVFIFEFLVQFRSILELPIYEVILYNFFESLFQSRVSIFPLYLLSKRRVTFYIKESISCHWLARFRLEISILLFWYFLGSSLAKAFFNEFIYIISFLNIDASNYKIEKAIM